MKFFAKAVLTGFAIAMGSALFKKAAPYVGLGDKDDKKSKAGPDAVTADGATDPELQAPHPN